MQRTLWMLFPLLAACGGGAANESTIQADRVIEATDGAEANETDEIFEGVSEPAPPPVLVLAAFTLIDNDERGLSMDSNGVLSLHAPGQPAVRGPVISPYGSIRHDGELLATVEEDGTLRMPNGEAIAVIAEDGSTTARDRTVHWGPDGVLTGGNPDGPTLRISPVDSPAKRAATAALLLITLGRDTSETEVTTVEAAP